MIELILQNSDLKAQISDEDLDLIFSTWHLSGWKYVLNATKGYLHVIIAKRMGLIGPEYDHEDRLKLNNQRFNLRSASRGNNQANRGKQIGEYSSIYKGVHWEKQNNCWRVIIMVKNKGIHIGRFKLEHEAAIAYNKAATTYFGEFACLNVVKI